mmetsp:Transcript_6220/g.28533  ORF Transcript_6220/g.28533 Transcript_6220/m.28533 type:complete len:261 (+) Transcript_6220:1027-1809(+)
MWLSRITATPTLPSSPTTASVTASAVAPNIEGFAATAASATGGSLSTVSTENGSLTALNPIAAIPRAIEAAGARSSPPGTRRQFSPPAQLTASNLTLFPDASTTSAPRVRSGACGLVFVSFSLDASPRDASPRSGVGFGDGRHLHCVVSVLDSPGAGSVTPRPSGDSDTSHVRAPTQTSDNASVTSAPAALFTGTSAPHIPAVAPSTPNRPKSTSCITSSSSHPSNICAVGEVSSIEQHLYACTVASAATSRANALDEPT